MSKDMKQTFAILSVLLIVMLTSCKNLAEKADDLRLEDRFKEAAALYKEAADKGDAYAKWRLSNAYLNGNGVEYDKSKAWELLNEAHRAGCPQASFDVANSYLSGSFGVDKDLEKGHAMIDSICTNTNDSYSLGWYANYLFFGNGGYQKDCEKAFQIIDKIKDKNEESYLTTMALVYWDGADSETNDKNKGFEYFKKSYNRGSARAAICLGLTYLNGFGEIKKDINKGIEWLEKGIRRNDEECMKVMWEICLSEDSCYRQWHNVNRGIELLEKAGKLGNGDAYTILGVMYQMGDKVYKNNEKAFEYYTKAYELGSGWGTNNLGALYIDGVGCDKDIKKALSLFKQASDLGEGRASKNLYDYYWFKDYKEPHERDRELAKEYLIKAAKQGDMYANMIMGQHYLNYKGSDLFEKNDHEAFIYYKQAADMGHIDACRRVASMYENGVGCDKNPDKAKEYYNKTKAKDDDKEVKGDS